MDSLFSWLPMPQGSLTPHGGKLFLTAVPRGMWQCREHSDVLMVPKYSLLPSQLSDSASIVHAREVVQGEGVVQTQHCSYSHM